MRMLLPPGRCQNSSLRLSARLKVVGDALPAHRQIQPVAAGQVHAIRQPQQERRHPFLGLLATQHEHVLLRRQQVGRQMAQQLCAYRLILFRQPVETDAGIGDQGCFSNGFGGGRQVGAFHKAHQVAGHQEIHGVAAAVRHIAAQPHRAAENPVNLIGGIVLVEEGSLRVKCSRAL
jgi:hypothetical protein